MAEASTKWDANLYLKFADARMRPALDLMAQGVYRALDDCGLSIKDVDGLFCATTQSRLAGLALAEYLQLPEAYIDSTSTGGSSFMGHLARAEAAIAAGLCEVAVVAYGSLVYPERAGAMPHWLWDVAIAAWGLAVLVPVGRRGPR